MSWLRVLWALMSKCCLPRRAGIPTFYMHLEVWPIAHPVTVNETQFLNRKIGFRYSLWQGHVVVSIQTDLARCVYLPRWASLPRWWPCRGASSFTDSILHHCGAYGGADFELVGIQYWFESRICEDDTVGDRQRINDWAHNNNNSVQTGCIFHTFKSKMSKILDNLYLI